MVKNSSKLNQDEAKHAVGEPGLGMEEKRKSKRAKALVKMIQGVVALGKETIERFGHFPNDSTATLVSYILGSLTNMAVIRIDDGELVNNAKRREDYFHALQSGISEYEEGFRSLSACYPSCIYDGVFSEDEYLVLKYANDELPCITQKYVWNDISDRLLLVFQCLSKIPEMNELYKKMVVIANGRISNERDFEL